MATYKETYVFYTNSIPFDGHTYKTRALGGAESAVTYMARELARLGKRVLVFTLTPSAVVCDGVRYEPCGSFGTYIQKNIMDVFISVRTPEVFAQPLRARARVLWVHDAADQPVLRSLSNETIRKRIDYYITISSWQRESLLQRFRIPEDRVILSRNGVNRVYFGRQPYKRKKRLVYTSTPFRGLELLVKFFPEIRERVPGVELYVYSSMESYGLSREEDYAKFGPLYESCQQPGITLVGMIPQKELARELLKASLCVYPNIFPETSCIAALEAQAAGLPVITSRLGALPETVVHGSTGYLIDGDPLSDEFRRKFIDTVVHVLHDEEMRYALGMHAHQRILNEYCWDTIAEEWMTFFDKSRPTLSVCMIVKNEAAYIERSIASIRPIADEIIVVDTGSTDETKSLAERAGATVYDYQWTDDFSAARNVSLAKAKGEWILVLDADEVIGERDHEKIRQLLNVQEASAYVFFQRTYLDDTTVAGWKANRMEDKEGEGYAGYFDSPLVRLFRNHNGFCFQGAVHEVIEPSIMQQKKQVITTALPIHHYGKVRDDASPSAKGSIYLEIGKLKAEQNPTDVRSLFELATQYYELGRLAEAKEWYEKVIDLDARHYRALCDLGSIHIQERAWEKAQELLEKAVSVQHTYSASCVNLSIVYHARGKHEEACVLLREVLAREPQNITAYKHLGMVLLTLNQSHEALQCFRRMKKIDPHIELSDEYATASYSVGLDLLGKKEFSKAKKYFEECIRVAPGFAQSYNNLGVIYVHRGDLGRAEDAFRKVIELTEFNPAAQKECAKSFINLGFVYNNKGIFQKAIEFLQKGVAADPLNPEIYNHLGIAHCGLGNLVEGMRYFDMTLQIAPQHHAAAINVKRVKSLLIQERNYTATMAKE